MSKKRRGKYHKSRTYRKKNMSGKYSRKGTRKKSIFLKIFEMILAIVAISALILFIILLVERIYNAGKEAESGKVSKFVDQYFKKSKINENESNLSEDNFITDDSQSEDLENEIIFKVCIISDIHEDLENLNKASEKIKTSGCRYIFVIGDLTNYGDVESLTKVRDAISSIGVEYYALPGDHDLAESLSVENFNSVFGSNYHIMEYEDVTFMLVDNSANFTKIGSIQMDWIKNNIEKADFVILSQPLYVEGLNPPFNSIYMGSMTESPSSVDMEKKQREVREQGKFLLDMIRKNKNVKAIIAGEHHRSSNIPDPVRSDLVHYVAGAITSTVNDFPQTAIQTPRFSVLSVYEEKKYSIEDVVID